jgi:hypothetical protein
MPAPSPIIKFSIDTEPGEPFPLPSTFKVPTAVRAERGMSVGECIGRAIAGANGMTFIGAKDNRDGRWFVEVWGLAAGLSFIIIVEP